MNPIDYGAYRMCRESRVPGPRRASIEHGGYLTDRKIDEALNDPDTIIQLARNLKAEREKRQSQGASAMV